MAAMESHYNSAHRYVRLCKIFLKIFLFLCCQAFRIESISILQNLSCKVCSTCGRAYPMPRLLELHVLETHDSLFLLLAKKQKMVLNINHHHFLFLFISSSFATQEKMKERKKERDDTQL